MGEDFIFYSDDLVTLGAEFDKTPVEGLTESFLEVTLEDLNERWTMVHSSYRSLCTDKDEEPSKELLASARAKYVSCTKVYHKCKATIRELLKSFSEQLPAEDAPNPINEDSFSHIKVPPCDTDNFYGGYEEWPSFRDMFTAVYVENPRIPAVQKLYYLRLKVQGSAGSIIRKYQLCSQNFALAWEALKDRYENQRILVENQIKILLNLPSVIEECSESLQKLQCRINDCLAAIKAQDVPVGEWDPFIVILCSIKLPKETLALWEHSLESHRKLVKWERMDKFLSHRCEVVERIESRNQESQKNMKEQGMVLRKYTPKVDLTQYCCKICRANHPLKNCSQFLSFDPQTRNKFVTSNKICLNCLAYTHLRKDCPSKFTCSHCKKNHHSLLHFFSMNTNSSPQDREMPSTSTQARERQLLSTSSHLARTLDIPIKEHTILPTAIVQILHQGQKFKARAFLDQGSEKTFISKKLQQQLMLPTESHAFEIFGIGGQVVAQTNSLCKVTLCSEKHGRQIVTDAIVMPKISRMLPSCKSSRNHINTTILKDLDLADPTFYTPGHVDILIGSDALPHILLDGVKKVSNSIIAQSTVFGWIVSGAIKSEIVSSFSLSTNDISSDPIGDQLKVFWEQEEVSLTRPISKEDRFCEDLYRKTTYRNAEGRYIVKLPFKPEFPKTMSLGTSRASAVAQFLHMENSLKRKPELDKAYHNVLHEYLTMNHMEPTKSSEITISHGFASFYLPHHAVEKPDSQTTKVRVVFNASKRSNSSLSLNDVLYVGPTLQSDLMKLILNWRFYKYVFNGDIEKMYRQILVYKEDSQFQRILFRQHPKGPITDYALKTVTFGINCAPYLAIRTLIQLAHDSEDTFPQASNILRHETYVDDILSGSHDLLSAIQSLSQLVTVLNSAGFPLKKITSNCPEILKSVPREDLLAVDFLKFNETSATKTLGIRWNAFSDCFSYTVDPIQPATYITKREILSKVARLFDPAGWISPVIIQAKIILQQLWLQGSKWDDKVSPNTLATWNTFVENLPDIAKLEIPRWIGFEPSCALQIHGFCDASEKAYCAAVYLRVQVNSTYISHLFASKTKVSPINPISLPRLELCGAVLLANLVHHITNSMCQRFQLFLWTDSTIVLGWLQKPPSTWKTYVANRTSQIIQNVGNVPWRHVKSADNPADLGSRGCNADQLVTNSLWWNGPAWLQKESTEWPHSIDIQIPVDEKRKVQAFHLLSHEETHSNNDCPNDDLLNRFSKWDRAIRVMSYVIRFIAQLKIKCCMNLSPVRPHESLPNTQIITSKEFVRTKIILICITQRIYYKKDYEALTQHKGVGRKSSILPLNPYLDENGIIRANGRISHSNIPFNEKHPIILPNKSAFSRLFIHYVHHLLVHAEINLMLRIIRSEYFIPRLKSAIRFEIRNCITCVRYKQKVKSQIMGALPTERSSFSLPFTFTGLDFAGPFPIKTSLVRNAAYHKGYVCVFVCFSTKAIHLELCSDLTTGSFRAAFTRFVGRRGLPRKVMSDNGTNFVGAERAFQSEYEEFIKAVSHDILEKYSAHGFHWTFIPPHAPHMGGLWEAGVKAFKMHFKKVAQGLRFTFEEFTTLLVRIESVLNSRPLSPVSDDPNELLALTPGHFLRGSPLIALPEAHTEPSTLHERWERLKCLHHRFAQRWKDEYLKDIQKRYKWQHEAENIKVGQLVVIKDDTLPPNEWKLARIQKIYLGDDGNARVADLKTQTGIVTRALPKLCVLPVCSGDKDSSELP